MDKTRSEQRGVIYTPRDFADLLVSWAVECQGQSVLDLGVGAGVFVLAAYERLIELGATSENARKQIYGAEIDVDTFNQFVSSTVTEIGGFPNVQHGDFFRLDFPTVDAVVGNPPYVRRTYLEDIDEIRDQIRGRGFVGGIDSVSRHADLYMYFLFCASAKLRTGGKLAVITPESWLNVGYGEAFKELLRQQFVVRSLISFDRRVFSDAQVKPVLLMATKSEQTGDNQVVDFIRVRNGLPPSSVRELLATTPSSRPGDIAITQIRQKELAPAVPWGIHLKAPGLYADLAGHPLMVPVEQIAQTRIGLQTLAKEFFVLNRQQVEETGIESEFLRPLAQSPRYFNEPIIEHGQEGRFFLFFCSKTKAELEGTRALEHVLRGERATVPVRGKGDLVTGYHRKTRIRKTSRDPWYDLKTDIDRRGIASILIPRLTYQSFTVVWNKASFVPGELFIEFLPYSTGAIETEAYLAILSSTIFEIMVRSHAQVYGGGTYNINPGQIRLVPMINVTALETSEIDCLAAAYRHYIADEAYDRSHIDSCIADILRIDQGSRLKVRAALDELIVIATSSKRSASYHPEGVKE